MNRPAVPALAAPALPITSVSLPGQIQVHAVSTGHVAVTQAFLRAGRAGFLRKARIMFNRQFAGWMPIYVWVIEHPEGIFVVDTGENCAVTTPGYFRGVGWLNEYVNTRLFRFAVTRELEIDQQLLRLGIRPADVRAVVLTHLHLDHTDGLRHFPSTPVLVNRAEADHPSDDLPALYPATFAPTPVDLQAGLVAPFSGAFPLTQARDLWLVSTPGHTPGHCSVLLQTPEKHYFFAGDVSYTQDQLLGNELPGAHVNLRQTRQTYQTIRNYAAQQPLVYLPTHDVDSARRLAVGAPLPLPGVM
jgi:glyoxylase-like metal-dependent hydrolase (beta-lactamase superfamily II)